MTVPCCIFYHRAQFFTQVEATSICLDDESNISEKRISKMITATFNEKVQIFNKQIASEGME